MYLCDTLSPAHNPIIQLNWNKWREIRSCDGMICKSEPVLSHVMVKRIEKKKNRFREKMVGQQLLHHFSTKAEGLEDVLNEHGLKKTPTFPPTFSPVTSKLPPDLRKFELKRNFSSSLAENAFLGITNIYWGCQTGNLYPMLQQSVQHTQTPYTSNLNWQNTAVVSIHGASSKTTNLWKRKKKKSKFTLIYVSLQMMQKNSIFVCLFVFLLWHKPARRENDL